jgi:hypothetical protein
MKQTTLQIRKYAVLFNAVLIVIIFRSLEKVIS